jgi:hypothetical protein
VGQHDGSSRQASIADAWEDCNGDAEQAASDTSMTSDSVRVYKVLLCSAAVLRIETERALRMERRLNAGCSGRLTGAVRAREFRTRAVNDCGR